MGGVMRWHFCQREPTTTPTPDTMTRWWSICGGGALRFTNTKDPHHRRKRGAGAKHKSPMRSGWAAQVGSYNRV